MRMKASGGLMAALAILGLCACGAGKQNAAVALDEARLSISSARKAGAESSSPAVLATALASLSAAEDDFKRKNFSEALDSAQKARDSAREAEQTAKAESSRPKRRAKTAAKARK